MHFDFGYLELYKNVKKLIKLRMGVQGIDRMDNQFSEKKMKKILRTPRTPKKHRRNTEKVFAKKSQTIVEQVLYNNNNNF